MWPCARFVAGADDASGRILPSLLRKGPYVQKEVKRVRKYETLYVLRPDLEPEKTQEHVERFKGIVAENGGELTELNEWGKRRLAYEIEGHREGYYVIMQYDAPTDLSAELERLFRISDDVMRYITTRIEQ